MGTWRVCALTVLLGCLLLGGTAQAQQGRAAVLPLRGPQAAKVRQRVQNGLRAAEVPVVPLKKVSAVARKTQGYARQANRMKATVLVGGRIRRVGERWVADVGIRNETGARVRKLRTAAKSMPRLSSRIVKALIGTGLMPTTATAAPESVADAAVAAPPEAEPSDPRLVVRPFTGPQAGKTRAAAVRGLKGKPVELVPNATFTQKARSLNSDLATDQGHVLPARALGVNGLIDGDLLSEDGVWSAYVRLLDGSSGEVIRQHYYEGDSASALNGEVQARIWEDFRKDIERFERVEPVAVTPLPVRPKTAESAPESEAKKERRRRERSKRERPAAVDIGFDFKFLHRNLTWNDDAIGNLRDYTLGFGPGVQTKFQYFPGAHFTSGVGAQFGIDFEWERLFKFDSTREDGRSFPTTAQQFLVGLRWRYPVNRWEPTIIVDYGVQRFEFGVSDPPVTTAGVPGVRYEFLRVGTGFRVAAGKNENYIIVVNGAYRAVFSAGGIETEQWFPESTSAGMDAMIMFGYALPLGFEVRVAGDYRRYWFDLNPVPPDPPFVAGGALDQYWGFSVGAAWRY